MIALQLAKKMGAKVIAVSKHNWIKESEFGGADYLISDYNRVADQVKDITQGKNGRCRSKFTRCRYMRE
jgi:NADPH:quinone reductase-like Zn-dependent oxidoreductase